MYARVFSSSAEPEMRGPTSTCFLTWSIARSPLNPTAAGTIAAGVGDGEATLIRELVGRSSFFGQAVRKTTEHRSNSASPSRGALMTSVFDIKRKLHCPLLKAKSSAKKQSTKHTK